MAFSSKFGFSNLENLKEQYGSQEGIEERREKRQEEVADFGDEKIPGNCFAALPGVRFSIPLLKRGYRSPFCFTFESDRRIGIKQNV